MEKERWRKRMQSGRVETVALAHAEKPLKTFRIMARELLRQRWNNKQSNRVRYAALNLILTATVRHNIT
ncbi:hypothetical protein EYF80_012212 [Liparis tanakae]|uniref:Uncharacterized protein n=1 Tax=Liparis tanakae TaxID=230148 RepID=A0A4Z2IK28_9TELE|nr:hypothetical protein EYF80_012212 [Liparis tanakae]